MWAASNNAGVFGHCRWHGDKAKASHLARVAIGGQKAVRNRSVLFKESAHTVFCGIERQVTNVKLDLE